MSTWTFDGPAARRMVRRAFVLGVCLSLAGCVIAPQTRSQSDVLQQVALYDGEVVVSGPPGYCIDGAHIRRGASGAFVPMASCESLTGTPGVPVQAALMTVSVLPRTGAPAQRPTAQEIAASMAPIEALDVIDGPDLSMVRFAMGGGQLLPGGDPRYWRGGMVINGHLLGLSVYGPAGSSLAGTDGRRLLSDLAQALQAGSPDLVLVSASESATSEPPAQTPDAAPEPSDDSGADTSSTDPDTDPRPTGLRSLLSGLFRNSG
ncbi:hypothetical protein SAMN05443432_101296 [Roseovarius litoreus]|uniref:Uncharacterized protein n=1 Tax=Roseovarius litoreus TaxID=1155722 RepID=A0A1M7A4U3_9RHOB|nr:hypothetical protein [Roseovarius litoreus]SHL37650.1 hypothetical protein SAMN05443432_101296 [Roseovarius litoreus]